MEYIIYLILTPIAYSIIYVTVMISWKYRKERVGRSLLVYFLCIIVYLSVNLFELIAHNEFWLLLWTKMQISIYSFIPVVWIIFAIRFSSIEKFLSRMVIKLSIIFIPVLSTLLVWTYPLHHLFYTGHRVSNVYRLSTLNTDYGFFFWVFGAYSYALFIAGSIIIIRHILGNGHVFHKLSSLIFLGSLLPLIANILYILPLPFFVYKDFTPLALAISGIFFFIGIYWHRLLEVIPIARNFIVEEMDQGIIILDKSDQIIDINNSALRILGLHKHILGLKILDIPEIWSVVKHSFNREGCTFEALIKSDTDELNCSVRIKPISFDQQEEFGILITIIDITLLVNLYDEKMRLLSKMEETYVKLNSTPVAVDS